MGYDFPTVDSNYSINFGSFAGASPFTILARMQLHTHGSSATLGRFLANIKTASVTQYGMFFNFDPSGSEDVLRLGFSKSAGTAFPLVTWNAGFTANSVHTVIGTYDAANLKLYADTDATPKATVAETGTPDSGSMDLVLGNIDQDGVASAASLAGVLYEVGWWAGTALTGAECAQLGAGNAAGITLPTNYWPLITDLVALYGGLNGTLGSTAPTQVSHVGTNLYPLATTTRRRDGMLLGLGVG